MALREFADRRGVRWMVWDIRPGSTQMLLAGTEYPAAYYRAGWLSFRSLWGTEQRRLSPIPSNWETCPDAELVQMLEQAVTAEPARSRRPRDVRSAAAAPEVGDRPAGEVRSPSVVRVFIHPSGRPWTAYVTTPDQGGPPVLRFMSGGRSLHLPDWPADWADLPDELLADLLRAIPRSGPAPGPNTPRRRWNDPRP
jgi:hypothetical protein